MQSSFCFRAPQGMTSATYRTQPCCLGCAPKLSSSYPIHGAINLLSIIAVFLIFCLSGDTANFLHLHQHSTIAI